MWKTHTIGEKLILPAISEAIATVMHQDASIVVKSNPLSNNSVSRRINEKALMLKNSCANFYRQQNSLCNLMNQPYVTMKYYLWHMFVIPPQKPKEEMLFAKPLETDTRG